MYSVYHEVKPGSSTDKFKVTLDFNGRGGGVQRSHLCSKLENGYGTTAVADTPLRTYAEVAGWGGFALAVWMDAPKHANYWIRCGAGTTRFSDLDCPLAGHVALTVSAATRKKFHLKSRKLFDADIDGVAPPSFPLMVNKAPLNFKFPKPRGVPATLKVTLTKPRKATFSTTAKLRPNDAGWIRGASGPFSNEPPQEGDGRG
jgi:hypothetical protein